MLVWGMLILYSDVTRCVVRCFWPGSALDPRYFGSPCIPLGSAVILESLRGQDRNGVAI